MGELTPGCVIFVCVKSLLANQLLNPINFIDAICTFNSATRLSLMVSKEHLHIFDMKYDLN